MGSRRCRRKAAATAATTAAECCCCEPWAEQPRSQYLVWAPAPSQPTRDSREAGDGGGKHTEKGWTEKSEESQTKVLDREGGGHGLPSPSFVKSNHSRVLAAAAVGSLSLCPFPLRLPLDPGLDLAQLLRRQKQYYGVAKVGTGGAVSHPSSLASKGAVLLCCQGELARLQIRELNGQARGL